MDSKLLSKLKHYKKEVLDYIEKLPAKEEEQAVIKSCEKGSTLKNYFDFQNNTVCSFFHGSYKASHRLKKMRDTLDQKVVEQTAPIVSA